MKIHATIDANKVKFDRAAALTLVKQAARLLVTKTRHLHEFDLVNQPPGDELLAALVLGPSGTLRAPSARIGDTFLVGFTPELFERVLRESGAGRGGRH